MQIFFRALLAIYLGHLLADFVFQPPRLVSQKRSGGVRAYLIHGLAHFFATLILLAFFVRGSATMARTYFVLLALSLVHLLFDFAKIRITQRGLIPDGARAYLLDQLLHAFTVFLGAWLLSPGVSFSNVAAFIGIVRSFPAGFLLVPVIYVAVMFGGGYLIRDFTRALSEGVKRHSPEKSAEQLQNAGLYIGWLERFLVITALLLHSPASIGLILTAKSIARYPEFKSEHFAEYFLIGTLLSIAMAILGGIILVRVIFGAVRFS